MDNMTYMAYDGDNAGRLVGRAILANDVDMLHEVSNRINLGHDIVKRWVESHGGQVISGGGDEGTFAVPAEALSDIEQLREDYQYTTNMTMTVGLGANLSEAGKALLVGKFRGKNAVVQYDQSIEQEIQEASARVAEGSASPEERKLGEAYLRPEADGQEKAPETRTAEYAQMEVSAPSIEKPLPGENPPKSVGPALDSPQSESIGNQMLGPGGVPNEQAQAAPSPAPVAPAQETGQEVAQEIEATLENEKEMMEDMGSVPDGTAVSMDADSEIEANLANEQEMLEQIDPALQECEACGRPMGYDTNTPGDMGLAEEQADPNNPDLTEVLQGGLDNHANQLRTEQVRELVGQALEGFKANKHILERAKEMAPDMYNSTIAMLKAMIEMAKMLGLGAEEAPVAEEQPQAAPQQAAPQPAAARGDAAQDPKAVRQ